MRTSKLQKDIQDMLKDPSPSSIDTFVWPSWELIDTLGKSQQSVNRSINKLIERGVINRVKRVGAINHNSWS